MQTNRGYLVIPKLIRQPTWGGFYIAKIKGWSNMPYGREKIGQSYELYSKSNLSMCTDTSQEDFQPEFEEPIEQALAIETLIYSNPRAILGLANEQLFGSRIKTLIKFTQAKGNSYQIHIKPGVESTLWKPKPESWYFFEEGMATLGISDLSKIDAYKMACVTINQYLTSLSQSITTGQTTVENARSKAKRFVAGQNIAQYVHDVTLPADTVVSLHEGGIHHSWEEDDKKIPLGNVLYEVQEDVMDPVSTIRCFDKGKIQEDGAIRQLQIEDYFKYVDVTPEGNDPSKFIGAPKQIAQEEGLTVKQVFDTKYYKMQRLDFDLEFSNKYTSPHNETFHHLFVYEGSVKYDDGNVQLAVGAGHSVFVPASVLKYSLKPTSHKASVLKTYV